MELSDAIHRAAAELSPYRQLEVLDFIGFLKARQAPDRSTAAPQTPAEMEAFFRSFNVDLGAYRFDREQANAR